MGKMDRTVYGDISFFAISPELVQAVHNDMQSSSYPKHLDHGTHVLNAEDEVTVCRAIKAFPRCA